MLHVPRSSTQHGEATAFNTAAEPVPTLVPLPPSHTHMRRDPGPAFTIRSSVTRAAAATVGARPQGARGTLTTREDETAAATAAASSCPVQSVARPSRASEDPCLVGHFGRGWWCVCVRVPSRCIYICGWHQRRQHGCLLQSGGVGSGMRRGFGGGRHILQSRVSTGG